jgi:hypothetical protein
MCRARRLIGITYEAKTWFFVRRGRDVESLRDRIERKSNDRAGWYDLLLVVGAMEVERSLAVTLQRDAAQPPISASPIVPNRKKASSGYLEEEGVELNNEEGSTGFDDL